MENHRVRPVYNNDKAQNEKQRKQKQNDETMHIEVFHKRPTPLSAIVFLVV